MKRLMLVLIAIFIVSIAFLLAHRYTSITAVSSTSTGCIDIAASPDYLSTGDAHDAIAAINNARKVEHIRPLHLPADFYQLDPAKQQFILLNLERTDRRLPSLKPDKNLSQMAWGYSEQLFYLNFFAHTSPISGTFSDRMNGNPAIVNHYSQAAENLAGNPVPGIGPMYEYMYDDSVEACGHRQNILNPALNLVGIHLLRGSIYGSISAQEFLTSAPWKPYVGSTPHVIVPQVSISVNTPVGESQVLQCRVLVKDDIGMERITWFLDTLNNPLHTGATLTLDTRHLSPGKHILLVYAVDAEQKYGVAKYTIVVG